jgi:hypothetical protein
LSFNEVVQEVGVPTAALKEHGFKAVTSRNASLREQHTDKVKRTEHITSIKTTGATADAVFVSLG